MTAISFEFYPPKTDEQRSQLDRAAAKLKDYGPEYVSCTFGAGGSTLSYTSETVRHLNQHHGFDAAPHLSCVGGTRQEIRELLCCTAPSAAAAWSRCVATCPGMGFPETCATPPSDRLHPYRARRCVPHRSGRVSGDTSAGLRFTG